MEQNNLSKSLNRLEEIVDWFDEQKEVDVEKGLEMVKEGAALIKASRVRLKDLENEFEEVKRELGEKNSVFEQDEEGFEEEGFF